MPEPITAAPPWQGDLSAHTPMMQQRALLRKGLHISAFLLIFRSLQDQQGRP